MKLREISDRFIIGPFKKLSELRKFISPKAAASVLAVLIILSAVVAGAKLIPALMNSGDDSVSYKKDDLVEIDIELSDFLIPEEIRSLDKFSWVPFRAPRKKWSREEIDEFWINPEETVRKAAEEKNKKHIESLFESIP